MSSIVNRSGEVEEDVILRLLQGEIDRPHQVFDITAGLDGIATPRENELSTSQLVCKTNKIPPLIWAEDDCGADNDQFAVRGGGVPVPMDGLRFQFGFPVGSFRRQGAILVHLLFGGAVDGNGTGENQDAGVRAAAQIRNIPRSLDVRFAIFVFGMPRRAMNSGQIDNEGRLLNTRQVDGLPDVAPDETDGRMLPVGRKDIRNNNRSPACDGVPSQMATEEAASTKQDNATGLIAHLSPCR